VFADGCFWHGCPEHGRRTPGTHAAYRADKLRRTQERDADAAHRLREAGWLPLRLREHQDPAVAAREVAATVLARRQA
jgi:DNA mismatch endonuclease (patch repair protein)